MNNQNNNMNGDAKIENGNVTITNSNTIQTGRNETNNNNQINPSTLKLFRSNSNNVSNMSNTCLMNNINYLNECFLSKNLQNDALNSDWKNIDINGIISQEKLNSTNPDEIMYKGYLNKLVISHMFKNCPTSVEKFTILTKDRLSIYKNKENYLLMAKPQHTFLLSEIINCKRIDFSSLKISKLEGYFFLYIEIERIVNSKEENEDLIFNIIKREKEGKFFVLFSQREDIINEWVMTVNHFKGLK